MIQSNLRVSILIGFLAAICQHYAHAKVSPGVTLVSRTPIPRAPKVDRGNISQTISPIPGGARLTVRINQTSLKEKVALYFGFDTHAYGINAGNAWTLTEGQPNVESYATTYTFDLNFSQMMTSPPSASLASKLANGNDAVIGAAWRSCGHRWGGTDRGGVIKIPSSLPLPGTPPAMLAFGQGLRPIALDIAQPITTQMRQEFMPQDGIGGLLDTNGHIQSRVEAEGKYQLTEAEFLGAREILFGIANDPVEMQRVFAGNEWTLKVENRYMRKNARGRLLVDARGFPVPDPMIDTYYDNKNFDAAKRDVAIRYRYTKNNNYGSWNFKPGMGWRTREGIVYRVEYGIDTVDARPQSIASFANSTHGLNPFQLLRTIAPGTSPSSFFHPAVMLTDDRYKFTITHVPTSLTIEVSLDSVLAHRLMGPTVEDVRFYQLEMDIEHVAVQAQMASQPVSSSGIPTALLHTVKDSQRGSPLLIAQASTFSLAGQGIEALTRRIFANPGDLRPGAQKYAFAVAALRKSKQVSPSVARLGFLKGKCDGLYRTMSQP